MANPILAFGSWSVTEGQTLILNTSLLSATDAETLDSSLLTFTASSVRGGSFYKQGLAVTSFTLQDIETGSVSFVHNGTETAPSFAIKVTDAEGLSSPLQSIIPSFTKVNDLAVLSGTRTLSYSEEGAPIAITKTILNASDAEGAAASTLTFKVTILGVGDAVADGFFYKGSYTDAASRMAAKVNSFTLAELSSTLASDNIFFQPGTYSVKPFISVVVNDGIADSPASNLNVYMTAVNDLATLSVGTFAVIEGASLVLSTAHLNASDEDSTDSQLRFTVSGTLNGKFTKSGSTSGITSFTLADVKAGLISYTHNGSEAKPSFSFTVTDASGVISPAQAASFDFSQFQVNDAPTGTVTLAGTATQGQTLTASNTLADADGLDAITYTWKNNLGTILGTGSSYVLTEAEVGRTLTVTASYTDAGGTAESKVSAASAAVANVNDAPVGSIIISGTAAQGQTLTAVSTLSDADGLGAITYTWKNSLGTILGTGSTYLLTSAEIGKTVTVTASYIDGHGTAETKVSAASVAVANVNDAPTGSVTIAGSANLGQTLTASNTLADVDGLGVISYQWQANGMDIAGATASTYLLTASEVGKSLSVTATYTDGYGTVERVASAATASVSSTPVNNSLPSGSVTITGTATQNQVLTAANTLADLDGVGAISYQWKANGVAIPGATASSFTLQEAQVGKIITVTATYLDGLGTRESVTSAATTSVVNVNDAPTGSVNIAGSPVQGQTLTASNTLADLDGMGTVSYQWRANGSTITGATSSAFVLTQAQVGKLISVTASYVDGHGSATSKTSSSTAAVANINDLPTGDVLLAGFASQGHVLTASNTLADADGLGVISYQWKADGVAVSGATASSYALTQADVGKTITVTASYTDGFGTAESRTSAGALIVADLPPSLSLDTLIIEEREAINVTSNLIRAADDNAGDSQLLFTISGLSHATFQKNLAGTWTATNSFTQADISAGNIRIVHDGSNVAPAYSVSVTDGLATATQVAGIGFTATNDAPLITAAQPVTLDWSTHKYNLSTTSLNAYDRDSEDVAASLVWTWSGLDSDVVVQKSGVTVSSFTQADLAAGRIQLLRTGTNTRVDDDFATFTVTDSAGASSSAELAIYDDAMLHKNKWSDMTLNYCFLTKVPSYYSSTDDEQNGFVVFSDAQKAAAREILAYISTVTNLKFVENTSVTDGSQSHLTFASHAMSSGSSGFAYYANNPTVNTKSGDVWISSSLTTAPTKGTSSYKTFLHEIEHALGNTHPYDDSTWSGTDRASTVMSYNRHSSITGTDAQTYLIQDLWTLQKNYGANMSTNSGNTTYLFSDFNGKISTLWDAGGVDTFDFSSASYGLKVDLREGHFSDLYNVTSTGTDNLSIPFNVTIENCTGGAYADTLIGNTSANVLNGGNGNNTLIGGGGADVLIGGSGADLFVLADTQFVSVSGGAGTDTLQITSANFDFTDLAAGAVTSIEMIDLLASAVSQRMRIKAADILDCGALTGASALKVAGNAGDTVDLDLNLTDYAKGMSYTSNSVVYDLWHSNVNSSADILIQQGVVVV
ncbi:MAG: hypothetical protein RL095_1486 [Verrucomicrobiota bacterium]|jgi:hypothetical protein